MPHHIIQLNNNKIICIHCDLEYSGYADQLCISDSEEKNKIQEETQDVTTHQKQLKEFLEFAKLQSKYFFYISKLLYYH